MHARLCRALPYDGGVRTANLIRASTVRAQLARVGVVSCAIVLGACGDGINEGAIGRAIPTPPALTTPPTTQPARPFPRIEFQALDPEIIATRAEYSGARVALHLPDGSWLAAGYDNHSTRAQAEPGAVWRSDDLLTWERAGDGISDESGQQVIASLVAVDQRIIAAGTNFVRDDLEADLPTYDADVWVSDDHADSFRKVHLGDDASVLGAAALLDALFAWGYEFDSDGIGHGQIWRSDDRGDSWQSLSPVASPEPGAAVSPLGPIQRVVQWDDALVAVGFSNVSDPNGDDYPLDEIALGSATETWEPIDITLSYSEDQGSSWHTTTPTGLSGLIDAQVAFDAVVVGDRLVLAGTAAQTLAPVFDPDERTDLEDLEDIATDPEFEFDTPRSEARLWSCDFLLQSCESIALDERGYDFVLTVVTATDGLVYAAATGFIEEPFISIERLFVFDPVSNDVRSQLFPSKIDQVNEVVADGDDLLFFGRDPVSDLLQVTRAKLS